MAYNLILRAIEAPGGSLADHAVLIHYANFANSKDGDKAWPSYAAVAKACHIKCEDTVAASVKNNIKLGYLVPIGDKHDKKTWAKKSYPNGKWAYIFKVNPPPLPKHKSQKSAGEDVRKTDTPDNQGTEKFGTLKRHKGMQKLPTKTPQGTEKFGTEGTENFGTILGINTTLESLPPTSTLKSSAEGGDIIPSVTKEEYFDALAEKQSAESKVRRKERYIQQLEIFAKRLHGKRAEDIATIIAQEKMRKAELEIRLRRAERAMPA